MKNKQYRVVIMLNLIKSRACTVKANNANAAIELHNIIIKTHVKNTDIII